MLQKLKSIKWEKRVTRNGHFQPKVILTQAETIPLQLTQSIKVHIKNSIWIHNVKLYEILPWESIFTLAFTEDKSFPLKIMDEFDQLTIKVENVINLLMNPSLLHFKLYVDVLKKIQKYYTIAVPLTNYCENELIKKNINANDFAKPFKELDIDTFSDSSDPKNDFPWLKTFYNIIEPVTNEDIVNQKIRKTIIPSIPKNEEHLITGLQIGIFLRNRIKELSQKLWFHIDKTSIFLAEKIGLTKEEFFLLTVNEVKQIIKQKKPLVSREELVKRQQCFVVGKIDNKLIIISGDEAKSLVNSFESKPDLKIMKGTIACQGIAKGKVKIIHSPKDKLNFNKGDILVTTMTTPDFLPLMAKATAIITDEGGLSCHAAIVSRELNIPCIIGTSNATKVLKNNQEIIVDAIKNQITTQ